MAKNTLEFIIKANITDAKDAFNQLRREVDKSVGGVRTSVKGMSSAIGGVSGLFESLTGISLTTAGGFLALGMAVKKTTDFIYESIGQTVAYAQSVRELSYVLGTSAEETSRIIQVADDYLISVDKVTTALRFAVKNGFEPSIESLANLADQFNAISDPNERAAKMVQIFGRNWSALVPMLKAGGDAIRENAAAISEGLVLDDADIQSVFEYQQALDQLGDAVQDLKYRIGMELVPALADVLTAFNTNASMADQMSRSFVAFNGVMEQSNRSALALENAFQLGFNVSPQGLVAIAEQLQAIEDPMKRVAEAQRIFGDNWVEVYGIIELSSGVLNALSGSLGKIPPDMNEVTRGAKVMAGALDDAANSTEALAAKEKLAGDALKGYAKNITKLGLTTQQENDLIAQFATSLGDIDTTALIAANDMDLLDAAMAANAITLDQYTAIALIAAQGTGELDDATRAYLENALLDTIDKQNKLTDAIKGTANAATVLRDVFGSIFDRTERWEGPRERVRETFEAMKAYIKTLSDPGEIAKFSAAMEAYGIAFGLFTPKSIAIEKAQIDYEALIGQVIDPVKAQAAMEAAFRGWKPGMVFDVVQILRDAGLLPDDSVAVTIQEEWRSVLAQAFTGIGEVSSRQLGDESRATRDVSPIVGMLSAQPGDAEAIRASYEPLKAIPQELIGSFAAITGEEGESILAAPIDAVATATGVLGENAGVAKTNTGEMAVQTGIMATNSGNLNTVLDTLPSRVQTLGEKAKGAYQPMRDLAVAIGDTAKSAQTATTAVSNLALAIASLSDKTVTITANVVLNDPMGLLSGGGGGGGGGGEYKPGPPRGRRARGGPVKPWEDYLVGEEGPELFIPQTAGEIIPADVTQAAILSAMQGFAPGREGTPETRNQERSKARRKRRAEEEGMAGEAAPFVPGLPTQPVPAYDPRFMGQNLDAYMEFFQAANSLAPGIRAAAAGGEGGPSDRAPANRRRRKKSWREGGGWTTEVENVINSTYQEFTGGAQSMKLPQAIGEIETNQGVNAGDAEMVRNPNGVVNNYFPISRVSDELDARQLARLVAAEMARMPSR